MLGHVGFCFDATVARDVSSLVGAEKKVSTYEIATQDKGHKRLTKHNKILVGANAKED